MAKFKLVSSKDAWFGQVECRVEVHERIPALQPTERYFAKLYRSAQVDTDDAGQADVWAMIEFDHPEDAGGAPEDAAACAERRLTEMFGDEPDDV